MSKKVVIFIIVAVIFMGVGGFFGYKYFSSDKTEEKKQDVEVSVWNPYGTNEKHLITLDDFLISAVGGSYVVKMTNTLELKDETAVKKYVGFESDEEELAEGEPAEGTVTPMQIKINSLVSTFMLEADEELILDKGKLEIELKNYLNKKLELDEDFIKELYIENYVVQ